MSNRAVPTNRHGITAVTARRSDWLLSPAWGQLVEVAPSNNLLYWQTRVALALLCPRSESAIDAKANLRFAELPCTSRFQAGSFHSKPSFQWAAASQLKYLSVGRILLGFRFPINHSGGLKELQHSPSSDPYVQESVNRSCAPARSLLSYLQLKRAPSNQVLQVTDPLRHTLNWLEYSSWHLMNPQAPSPYMWCHNLWQALMIDSIIKY